MTRACHLPISLATGGAFTDDEMDAVVERLLRKRERIKGEAPNASDREAMAAAVEELTTEEIKAALILRRMEASAKRAGIARAEMLAKLPGDASDKLRAMNVGTERQGGYSGFSVDAEGRARAVALWSDTEAGMRAEPGLMARMSNFWGLGEDGFDRLVAREMSRLNGGAAEPTGDRGAEIAARVLNGALKKAREMQNDAGAWIGELSGYVARQHHDRLKVSGGFWRELQTAGAQAIGDWSAASRAASVKAFREWHDFIRPRLDDATFAGIDPEDVRLQDDAAALQAAGVLRNADDLRERFLYHAWFNIVSGGHDKLAGASDLGEFRPPIGAARSASKARVLHFRSSDAWMDYHERFGRGSLYAAVMGDLERSAKNAALMTRWGPAPEAAFENAIASLTKDARAVGDDAAARKLGQSMRRAEFDEITGQGDVPDNLRFSLVMRAIRLDQTLSKLGGMVLSAFSDAPLAAQAHARAGGRFLDGYAGAFTGVSRLQGSDAARAADLIDVGARSAAMQLAGRFTAADGPLGWMASASRLFYKVNLFELWSEGLRKGMAGMLAAHMGEQAALDFGRVHAGWRETLERFGLDAKAWDLIRQGAARADDGRTYLTFEALADIPDAALLDWKGLGGKQATPEAARRARSDLEWRFRTLVNNHLDDTLTEARARERVSLIRGTKPGTILGEAARTFTQFWSFNMAIQGRHLAPAARGHSGRTPAALLAHIMVASTLMGYASLQAKQLAKGRTPRGVTNEDGEFDIGLAGKLWTASLLQGGGLGIYGDFLFGEASRGGNSFWATLGGPLVGELEKVAQVTKAAISGDVDDLPADLLKIGVSNTPFANLWYTRWALDAAVLWRLQEAASPGYLERYERRVREKEGADFLLSPTEIAG